MFVVTWGPSGVEVSQLCFILLARLISDSVLEYITESHSPLAPSHDINI